MVVVVISSVLGLILFVSTIKNFGLDVCILQF